MMPSKDQFKNIGDREAEVLNLVKNGYDDFQRIREQLTLSWRQLDYSIEKLEDADLVETRNPDGYTVREVDGQRRKFKEPRRVELTELGLQYLDHVEVKQQYRDMDRDELIETIHQLEERVERLEQGFQSFKKQIKQQLS